MPNPKTGTVTMDVAKAVTDFKGGLVEYRGDAKSHGVIHVPIGKVSFPTRHLVENYRAVLEELHRVKPASAKGRYVQNVTLSSTMGPGIKIDPGRSRLTDDELAAVAA